MEKIVVAHRGASAYEKENTLKAFEKAIELGAEMVEFDVRKTEDNVFIVYHNPIIKGKKISSSTYKEITEKANFNIPTLEETLIFLKEKSYIDVHLKTKGYEEEIMALILKHFDKSKVIVSSRHICSLKKIKRYGVKTILIIFGKTLFLRTFPIEKIEESGADFIAVHKVFATKNLIKKAEQSGKKVFVWGVKGREKMEKFLKKDGIFGVISCDLGKE